MNRFISQMQPNFDNFEAEACYKYMKEGGWVTEFKKTDEFSKMICDFTGAKYCHIVNNGTISLSIALLALDIKPRDEVIVPNITMIATPNAVRLIGAEPIFVDVEKDSVCIDINIVEKLLENDLDKKIKAVFHVSLNTRCNDIIKLKDICDKHNVYLIEDSAQSLGSYYNKKHLGTFGHIGSFSFSSPKIISTGQGGALITNCKKLSSKINKIKNFGRCEGGNDIHDSFGINSKFTDIQAVIGIEQMKKLPWRVNRMKEMWNIYYNKLSSNKKIHMITPLNDDWIPWFIDIYVDEPNQLQEYLKNKNIGTRRIYQCITSQKLYKSSQNYPIATYYSKKGLWLPSSTILDNNTIKNICDIILSFFIDI